MNNVIQTPRDILKTFVKTTPVIADIYLYLRFSHSANVYKGVYNTFQEARNAISPEFHADYNLLDAHQKPRTNLEILRPINYPMLAPLTEILAEASLVLDLGGGVGVDYYAFRQQLRFLDSLKWLVYEVPAAVEVGQELAAKNQCSNLSFTTDFQQANRADLLLTNGALQYLEPSLPDLLAQLNQPPNHLLINYVPCYEGETFFTVQNLGFSRCPYKIQSRNELIHRLEDLGYQLVKSWTDPRTCLIPFHPNCFVDNYHGFYFRR